MFKAVLFVIVKHWKLLKWPSLDEWLNKLWYVHTMTYYSAVKEDELSIHVITWMDLKDIILSGGKKAILKVHILHDSIYVTEMIQL